MKLQFPRRAIATVGLAAAFTLVLADAAFAQSTGGTGGNLGAFIQNIINLLNNNIIRGLPVIAIIITGIAWMFGHLDLRRAGTVIVGIILDISQRTVETHLARACEIFGVHKRVQAVVKARELDILPEIRR